MSHLSTSEHVVCIEEQYKHNLPYAYLCGDFESHDLYQEGPSESCLCQLGLSKGTFNDALPNDSAGKLVVAEVMVWGSVPPRARVYLHSKGKRRVGIGVPS